MTISLDIKTILSSWHTIFIIKNTQRSENHIIIYNTLPTSMGGLIYS